MSDERRELVESLKNAITRQRFVDPYTSPLVLLSAELANDIATALAADGRDGERYRWLRSATLANGRIPDDDWWDSLGDTDNITFDKTIDAAIDALRGEGEKHG